MVTFQCCRGKLFYSKTCWLKLLMMGFMMIYIHNLLQERLMWGYRTLISVNKDYKCASIRTGGRELLRKKHCTSIKQTQKKSCQLSCIFTGKFVFHNDFVPGKFSVIKIVVKIIYSSMILPMFWLPMIFPFLLYWITRNRMNFVNLNF